MDVVPPDLSSGKRRSSGTHFGEHVAYLSSPPLGKLNLRIETLSE